MKILNLLLIASILTGTTACLKKDNYNTDVKVLSVRPITKLKSSRELTVTATNTTISNIVYGYDADKRLSSFERTDSASNGGTWTVNTSQTNYEFNSSGRWSKSVQSMANNPDNFVTTYLYDSNKRLRNEIQTYGTNVDTLEYTHSNNTCTLKPKYPGNSYTKVFFTDGDPDSTISYLNNVATQKSYYSYTAKKDKSYAYFIAVMPLNPSFKEVNSIVVTGVSPKVYSYSYEYDDKDFATKKIVASPGETITTTYIYFSD